MRTKLFHCLSYLLCLFQISCFVALQRVPLHSSSFSDCSNEHKKIDVICNTHSKELQIEQKNLGNEILVYGFIREFEAIVANKKIPDCIMNLCVDFSKRMVPCNCIKEKYRKILPKLGMNENSKKALIFFLMYKIEDVHDEKDKLRRSILHYACGDGHLELAKLLRKWGANIHAKDWNGNNALHLACRYSGGEAMVTWLLDVCNIDLETKGNYKQTPFLLAAQKGQLAIAKLLKNRGANIHAKDEFGNNALHYACGISGSVEMVNWLLDVCKMSIEVKGESKRTPFLYAAEKEQLGIVKLLRQRGANIYAKNEFGNNALYLATIFSKNKEMIDYLESQIETKTGRGLNFWSRWFV